MRPGSSDRGSRRAGSISTNESIMRRLSSVLLAICMACCLSYGQKVAVVRNSVPYMEWLGGKPEVDDRDMRLCLAFDEDRNTLTVSLNSTNSLLFAFPRGVLYDNAFHGGNKLKAEHLPYKAELAPGTVVRISGPLRRSLRPNVRAHAFRAWLEYDRMDPVPVESKIPSDSLVQVFRVSPSEQDVTIRLKDVFFLSRKGSSPAKWGKFKMTGYKDLNLEYTVVIERDPCRGMADRISAVNGMRAEASGELAALLKVFPNGVARSLDGLDEFQSRRNDLLAKYSRINEETSCPEYSKAVASYNACVDSLVNLTCRIPAEYKNELVTSFDPTVKRIDAEGLLYRARLLDELTAQWQLETRKSAKLSIRQQCDKLIDEAAALAIGRRVITDADRKALDVFIQAKDYYTKVCK